MGHKNSKIFPYKIEDDTVSNDMEYYDCIFCGTKIHYFCQKYYRDRDLDKNFCIDCHQGLVICNDI